MINIFGEEEFKPLVRYGKVIPDYYVSKDGIVFSLKSNKILSGISRSRYTATGDTRLAEMKIDVYLPDDLYDDFEYRRKSYGKDKKSKQRMTVSIHRAVAETWKPIDDNPPIPKKDWDKCPESAKEWIRNTALIDHKDDNPRNNHVDNLQWVIPKDNNVHRKKTNSGENLK